MNKEQQEAFNQFSAAEIAKYQEAFNLFDRDGNGKITQRELGQFMRKMGMVVAEQELDDMINEVDADGSGYIDFPEFLALMARRVDEGDSEDDIRDAFRLFDREGNGYLAVEEIKHVMQTLGELMSELEINEMLSEANVDSEGQVNYEGIALIYSYYMYIS
ncbi:unnamed protein product [Dimorphilus gyrociliatus]|uniref:EF-hand domain-containing protein n=1 Tax=Dimorphilus gyrociliatus TaxID=2664684 RepID=A0A7I8VPN9_9ANNE|nr:unnamed protein product [Dimorphilus gyrociliatus]